MPNFYNYTQDGLVYSFDDVFVPADAFREGNLWDWGLNAGNLGDNTSTARSTPITTFSGGTNWKQVNSGGYHTVAIKTDGTLWTWGNNISGQIGDNTTTFRSTPVTTFSGGNNWKSIAGGQFHTVAIKTDGTLWTWGRSNSGQLGNNDSFTDSVTPVTTFAGGNNWRQIECGWSHTMAIKTDGTLWTWGRNAEGQLGDNTTTQRNTPVTTFLGGGDWKSIAGGQIFTASIKTDGTLWTWGDNLSGQLGDNSGASSKNTPVTTFLGGGDWKSVATGGTHITAIKTDGTLWTWGSNASGQLGDNTTTQRNTPVTTFSGGTNWKQVDADGGNTTTVKTDGTLWTWGRNTEGQVGDNTNGTNRITPVTTFLGGTNWKQVKCGRFHTVALTFTDPIFPT
jgi:alpha-tubulin suppressor-like RCC1 family protein